LLVKPEAASAPSAAFRRARRRPAVEMSGQPSADELLLEARDLMRRALVLVAQARRAPLDRSNIDQWASLIEFDAIPGRTSPARAEALYMGRRIRDAMFPRGLFGEPAWDLLLDLFLARRTDASVSFERASDVAGVPRATALRYLRMLEDFGLVTLSGSEIRGDDSVELSEDGIALMTAFFDATDGRAAGDKTSAQQASQRRLPGVSGRR
jgi:hypothetical protein